MVNVILEDTIYNNMYNFIKEKGIITQPEIIKEFTKQLAYDESKKTLNRVKIGSRLARLEKAGLIEKIIDSDANSFIPTNKWRVVEDDTRGEDKFSELSIKVSEE